MFGITYHQDPTMTWRRVLRTSPLLPGGHPQVMLAGMKGWPWEAKLYMARRVFKHDVIAFISQIFI